MSKFFAAILLAAFSTPLVAHAALDETLRIKESVEINAPADKVWAKIGNFGDMSWHPGIAKTDITSGSASDAGATRILTLKDGGNVNEVLVTYDVTGMSMKYEITESVLPVRDYSATLKVRADGDKSVVTWISVFKRKDPSHHAAPGQDDEAAKSAIGAIFKSGLESIKQAAE